MRLCLFHVDKIQRATKPAFVSLRNAHSNESLVAGDAIPIQRLLCGLFFAVLLGQSYQGHPLQFAERVYLVQGRSR